ncbi:family 5 carbohydrate esterase [Melampsora larici-populina 98AG31]|uniref:Family 5 carbohydrate esterase n=1 Tax=Melampsora larici-populina (strain 98AG31 / pathotype 3-4-7) TaxID=747676 RepID=F4RZ15_MELLP|nr:family 5 carbohydrate esterase [Melampsora larici-populina 98AG31]EGG02404.1 family 5 carbohydrate esterase [Melampsora larici-populina 98AG31]
MSSIRCTLLLLCLSLNLSTISATTSHLSLRDLRPRMMGGGGPPGGGKKGGDDAPKKPGGGGPPGAGGGGAAAAAPAAGGGGGGGGECGKYAIVSARGTGEKQKNPTGYAGFIKGLMKQVAGGSNYEVVYPATTDYNNGPKQGANDAMKYITNRKGKCGSSKLVLIGYSEGAMVITQLLNKQGFPADLVSSIVLYGNPYWIAGKQWNAGTAKSGKSIAAMTGIKLPPNFGPKTQDVCLTGDMICCGGSMGPHLKYPGSQYEKEAISFSAKLLNGGGPAAGGASGGGASGGAGGSPGGGAGGPPGGAPKKGMGGDGAGAGGPPGGAPKKAGGGEGMTKMGGKM